MSRLLAIDPSTRSTGWAAWDLEEKIFKQGGAIRAKVFYEMLLKCKEFDDFCIYSNSVVIIEKPQVYTLRTSKGNPSGLIDIATIGGFIAGASRALELEFVTPQQWKGSVPKEVHHKRFLVELKQKDQVSFSKIIKTLEEMPKTSQGDFLDACALGYWKLQNG